MGFVALCRIVSSVQVLVNVRALTLHLISWAISGNNTQPELRQKLGTVLDHHCSDLVVVVVVVVGFLLFNTNICSFSLDQNVLYDS